MISETRLFWVVYAKLFCVDIQRCRPVFRYLVISSRCSARCWILIELLSRQKNCLSQWCEKVLITEASSRPDQSRCKKNSYIFYIFIFLVYSNYNNDEASSPYAWIIRTAIVGHKHNQWIHVVKVCCTYKAATDPLLRNQSRVHEFGNMMWKRRCRNTKPFLDLTYTTTLLAGLHKITVNG